MVHNFVNILKPTELCILNEWILWYVNYISNKGQPEVNWGDWTGVSKVHRY